MNNQNIDSRDHLLSDAELDATHGGGELLPANDPTFIPATDPADRPRDMSKPLTPAQLRALAKWFRGIR
ncbi:MAG: hypothetical protein RL685_7254 [Pseudomonadota bacterium]